jgi:hypothetical protein
MSVDTSVAMVVFNRPDVTSRVLEVVRAARPRHLLVVADGPRPSRPDDESRCAAVRALFDRIDWPCEVEREFSPVNLGCRRRVSSGIAWVFSRVEEAIVLEDDCLPHPTFFDFCAQLLDRHREDPRVMAITGDNFQAGRRRGEASYYFSRFMHVWGWASWRRAWRHYDVSLRDWPERRETRWLEEVLGNRRAARNWSAIFDRTSAGEIDTWDYQWVYSIWAAGGLVATPNENLVANIGAGADATHTLASPFIGLPVQAMEFPLVHPAHVAADDDADRFVQRSMFTPTLRARVGATLRRLVRSR